MLPPGLAPDEWPRILEHGDTGAAVAIWQAVLEANDYDVTDLSGSFGDSTHNGTMAWQLARQLGVDGRVGPQSRGQVETPPILFEPSVDIEGLPEIKFTQAKHYTAVPGGRPTPIWWIVHCTDGAEASTKAERIAKWFGGLNKNYPAPRASTHYAADCDSIVQMVKSGDVAWGARGANRLGKHIEHAGRARQTRTQWMDDFSLPMLELSAMLAARDMTEDGIPLIFRPKAELIAGKKAIADGMDRAEAIATFGGVTSHDECRKAFGGTHWDPGHGFPWDHYFTRIQHHMDAIAA